MKKCECLKKQPSFNLPGATRAINVKEKKCACGKIAYYGLLSIGLSHCGNCRTRYPLDRRQLFISRPNKRCEMKGCIDLATYGVP